jgi:cephalosporin hydroxylase
LIKFGTNLCRRFYRRIVAPSVNSLFFCELVRKTDNFGSITWLGHPIWQNILDLWTIQETIAEIKPSLLIESGTNRGGSSLFFAHLFDLIGHGEVVTVDVERLHNLSHHRITYLVGNSTSEEVLRVIQKRVSSTRGPVMVILDSDHSRGHVLRELLCYTPFVTPGSYCLVQDGVIDTLSVFHNCRPGPLLAIQDFLRGTDAFVIDSRRCDRFLITHHPSGWLRRKECSTGSDSGMSYRS